MGGSDAGLGELGADLDRSVPTLVRDLFRISPKVSPVERDVLRQPDKGKAAALANSFDVTELSARIADDPQLKDKAGAIEVTAAPELGSVTVECPELTALRPNAVFRSIAESCLCTMGYQITDDFLNGVP